MQLSELISILEGLRDQHGDLEVRTADWDYIKSDPMDCNEQYCSAQFVFNEKSNNAMSCDDNHNPDLVYPYVLIGA